MGENSAIQWTDHTFNPWIGCQRVSPGCVNCYAEHRNTFVRIQRKRGRETWGPKGERIVTSDANWRKPLMWNRKAEKEGRRARVFCASLADVFEARPELHEPRDRLFDLIHQTPSLDWQLLTKRPENVMEMVPESWCDGFPRNVWIGASAEDQQRFEERVDHLVLIPAKIRFLSCEPLLARVEIWPALDFVDWVIVGGESGDGARPFSIKWAREIIDECRDANVACFIKQLGANVTSEDRALTILARVFLRDSHGGDWNEWPEYLRIREFPVLQNAHA